MDSVWSSSEFVLFSLLFPALSVIPSQTSVHSGLGSLSSLYSVQVVASTAKTSIPFRNTALIRVGKAKTAKTRPMTMISRFFCPIPHSVERNPPHGREG
ncbi:hypothetical protein F4810DRAFT_646173 [Camillea tinctor]|nr:hypothetical protein F4810DRAFT_646173 [Camillea tinctor]